jgi:hypothetical protein
MPAKGGRRLHPTPGKPRGDPTVPQVGAVVLAVVGLVGVQLARRRPAGVATLGRSSTMAASSTPSLTLAAVTAGTSGSPWPSTIRCSLDPGLPRSTGFAPTWSPAFGAHAHGVKARPRPVHQALGAQPIQQLVVQPLEHAGVAPLHQAAADRRLRAAAKLTSGQQPPGGRGPSHVHDRGQAVAIADGTGPAAVPRTRRGRQQRRDDRPQLVRDEGLNQLVIMTRNHGIPLKRSDTPS